MGEFLGITGLLGVIVSIIIFLIYAITKRPLKTISVVLAVFFAFFVAGLMLPASEPVVFEAQPMTEEPVKVDQADPAAKGDVGQAAPTVSVGGNITVGEVRWKVLGAAKKEQIEQGFGNPLKPGGVFVVIELEAELLGKKSGTIWGHQFKIIDGAGRSFDTDSEAMMGLIFGETNPIIFEEIHPNVPKAGYVAFDVAKDATALKLRIGDVRFFSTEHAFVDLGL